MTDKKPLDVKIGENSFELILRILGCLLYTSDAADE